MSSGNLFKQPQKIWGMLPFLSSPVLDGEQGLAGSLSLLTEFIPPLFDRHSLYLYGTVMGLYLA